MKTVHLIFFISFGRKKTKFLFDHRNNGNTHKTCQRTNKKCMRPWRSAKVSKSSGREFEPHRSLFKKNFFLCFHRILNYQETRKKITSKIYNQQTHSEPNVLLLVQLINFCAITEIMGTHTKRVKEPTKMYATMAQRKSLKIFRS